MLNDIEYPLLGGMRQLGARNRQTKECCYDFKISHQFRFIAQRQSGLVAA